MNCTTLTSALFATLALGAATPALAAGVAYEVQVPPYTGQAQDLGLLAIEVDPAARAGSPQGFHDIEERVAGAIEAYVTARGVAFTDHRALGLPLSLEAEDSEWKAHGLDAVPATLESELVTVIKVLRWEASYRKISDIQRQARADVSLVVSTWTREGEEVLTQTVHTSATGPYSIEAGGSDGSFTTRTTPDFGRLALSSEESVDKLSHRFRHDDGGRVPSPTRKLDALFEQVIREASAIHFYALTPHTRGEHAMFAGGKTTKDGVKAFKAGDVEAARAAWQAAGEDKKAVYNLGVLALHEGRQEDAVALFERAAALKSWLAQTRLHELAPDTPLAHGPGGSESES